MAFDYYQNQTRPLKGFGRIVFPFLSWREMVKWHTFRADLLAGLNGSVVALPQCVAFAMIAGLPPQYGVYSAIIICLVAALYGSSMHMISGPAMSISIIIFSSISPLSAPGSPDFIRLTLTMTFLVGIFQLAFGLAHMGILVNFVSHSVIVGFTAGASILILNSQLRSVLGLVLQGGQSFLGTWVHIIREMDQINFYSVAVAASSLAVAVLFRAYRPQWPGLLFAMIVGSLVGLILNAASHGLPLMKPLPANLPPLSWPEFSITAIQQLTPKALAVSLLGLIQSLSISRSIAIISRQQIDGNREIMGQGLSNMVGSFFSSYVGAGSFTRSAINYHAGAVTPLSAVFCGIFLSLILLLVAPLTAYMPISALGGIVLLVAYNLIDFKHISSIIRTSKEEAVVMLATFLSTLFLELEFAIYVGVLLSFILYIRRTTHPEIVHLLPDPTTPGHFVTPSKVQCAVFKIIRINGSLFFGAVNHIMEFFKQIDKNKFFKSHILIVAYGINFIDITGAEMLTEECRRRRSLGGDVYLLGLNLRAREVLERGGYMEEIGTDHIFSSETEAVSSIVARINRPECNYCQSPLFEECKKKVMPAFTA